MVRPLRSEISKAPSVLERRNSSPIGEANLRNFTLENYACLFLIGEIDLL